MMDVLIEESAKAIFFKDMVDRNVSESFYDVWDFDTEPNAEVGDKIRERYKTKAIKHLKFIGVI